MKTTVLGAVLASAVAASAQVTYENGKWICAQENAAYCAGDSMGTDIIIRCNGKVGQPGRCSDNLAGYPPMGVNPALCWQTSKTSGDAACEKNCVVYGPSGNSPGIFTLPSSVCTPYYTPTATSTTASATSTSTSSGTVTKTDTATLSTTECPDSTTVTIKTPVTSTASSSSSSTSCLTSSTTTTSKPPVSSSSSSTSTWLTVSGTSSTLVTVTNPPETKTTAGVTNPPVSSSGNGGGGATKTSSGGGAVQTAGAAGSGFKAATGALAVLGGFVAFLV